MNYGIDYGNGKTNIDAKTGIRYGVVPQDDVLQAWADTAEGDYGAPRCPKCGYQIGQSENGDNYDCPNCEKTYPADDCLPPEPSGFTLDDGEYRAESGTDGDIFVILSPYYTHAQYCSPCAPGACHLRNPTDENGPRAYCFAPDWFDYCRELGIESAGEYEGRATACPYPVYRVSDNVCIYQPKDATQ